MITNLSFLEMVGVAIGALISLYLAVRLAAAAYFKSRQQYEQEQKHE